MKRSKNCCLLNSTVWDGLASCLQLSMIAPQGIRDDVGDTAKVAEEKELGWEVKSLSPPPCGSGLN